MSDAEPAVGRGEIWIEKYRPRTLDEVVGQEDITERLKSYIERNDLPNLLFSGPAGVGKCVIGETPVLTNRGVEPIANVVGDVDGFGTPEEDLRVLTLDDGEFRYVEPTHIFGKTTEELIAIETRDGGELTVTPEHRLLVLDHDGLQWTRAEALVAGDRIVRPLRTPLPATGGGLDWIGSMDGDRTLVHLTDDFAKRHEIPTAEPYGDSKRQVVGGIGNGTSAGTLSKQDEIVGDTGFDGVETACPLSALRRMEIPCEELREHIEAVEYGIAQHERSRPIRPPWEVTPTLATFLGLALSGAHIDQTGITFYNTDERLLDRFERSVQEVFAIEPTTGEENGVPYVRVNSRTLIHVLASCFGVFDGVTNGDGLGSTIVCSDDECRKAFLRAVFDAEGTVTHQGTIEVAQTNETLITVLAYLLSGFGIPCRRTAERRANNGTETTREYHVLRISGAVNLGRFERTIGWTDDEMAARIARHAAHDEAATPGVDLHYDAVERVDSIDEPRRVFDLTVPETKNYVAGAVPTVMHNTTSAHAIAREIYGDDWRENFMELNASDERGIDVVRDRIKNFARSSFGGYDYRVIFLDEADSLCVPPGTKVVTGYPSSPEVKSIEEVHEEGEPIPSVDFATNEVQSDKGKLVDSGVADFFELELADGRTILASLGHPFFVVGANGTLVEKELRELTPGDEIADFKDDVGVSRCEICGDWTAGRCCSVDCENEKHSHERYEKDGFEPALVSDGGPREVRTVGIRQIAYSHRGKAYNITMEDTPNFMLANGILTHNTSDAQSALRRTMEQFSHNTRFILSCNYSSQIIDPIQSRCAVFRFGPLPEDAVAIRIREIADAEDITVTDDGVDALVYAANGDMRKAINGLQAAAVLGETVDEEAVYTITSTARPEEIEAMVEDALDGEFAAARSVLDELLTEKGLAGGDVIDQLHRSVWEFELGDEAAVRILDRIGEADYRITEGANERIQLEALLASLALSAIDE